MNRRAGEFVLTIAAMLLLLGSAGCQSDNNPSGQDNRPASGPFAEVDRGTRDLVTKEASWQAPASMTVGETERIGLAIGAGTALKAKIDTLLPDTVRSPAGQVQVGPVVRASLHVNPADADVTPSDAINHSTTSDIQMLWTWLVHPKRPTGALKFTAHLEVPLDNGHTVTHELAFSVPVARTFMYTAEQVALHWGTWSAVAATLASVIGWFIGRRRNRRRAAAAAASASAADPAADPAAAERAVT